MRRRDQSGGKAAKTRRRKALKRRVAPKAARQTPVAGKETNIARMTRERDEALEQLAATSEVLKVISGSPVDLEPVFSAILANAARICEAKFGTLYLRDEGGIILVASHNAAFAETRRGKPFNPPPGTALGEAYRTKQPARVADLAATRPYNERHPAIVQAVEVGGVRSGVSVPLLKGDELLGLIGIFRQEVRPFTDKQVELVKNFAAQAVIAIENTRLLNELRESLQQQTATSEVLKVISSSPGELEPVFNAMLANATRICSASFGNLYLHDEDCLNLVASHNMPPAFANARRGRLYPPPESMHGRVIKTKEPVCVADLAATKPYIDRNKFTVEAVELGGVRTGVMVPLLKEKRLLGIISIYRREVLPFTDKQVELVQNFAAQAVIAIENARLLNELRQRTGDLSEALERQTATSEVLKVISSSPSDLKPVFQSMLENSVRICKAKFGQMFLCEGDKVRAVAEMDVPAALVQWDEQRGAFQPSPEGGLMRAIVTKHAVHIDDFKSEQPSNPVVKLGGARSYIAVPMLKESELVGVIVIYRQEVRPFTDKQIELVKNFAAQAVIAIENARLLNELRESLQQQTATADVLKVISSSPDDMQPVFEAIGERAEKLCDAEISVMSMVDGDQIRLVSINGVNEKGVEAVRRVYPMALDAETVAARTIRSAAICHVPDVLADTSYQLKDAARITGNRGGLGVPMIREGQVIGAIFVARRQPGLFTDAQVQLLKTFAAQAVIAIENTRLLNDLNKLNQQLEQRVVDQVSEIERMGRLRRFLPPQVADLIVASGTEKQLESHRREITALFCDLRGFTGFSESSDPEDVMALLHEYHAAIGGIINKYRGTLERYAGDGVMVVFNDPIPVDNPALQAVLMAIDMRAAIGELIEKWRKLGHDIGFGIGIAHGFATLGTIGFEGRFDYAAIGTVSNVASRLCDEAKPGQILISPRVLMVVEKNIAVEAVGDFELKGIRRPLTAYNVLAAKAAN